MTKDSFKNNRQASHHVILTGATGFVGRHIASELKKRKFNVVVLVRDKSKVQLIDQLKDCTILETDFLVSNINSLPFPEDNLTVIHCAWPEVHDTTNIRHIEQHFLSSYLFLKRCVELGVFKIIVTGSCYEYGLQYGPVSIHTELRPNTSYALAKVTLLKSLSLLNETMPFQLVWARLFYMYGEGQDEKSIIPLFDKALNNRKKSFDMSYGEQLFDYLPVEVVAEQLCDLIDCEAGIYNVCSGTPISLRRLLEQRMKEKNQSIQLNLGIYGYRKQDSLAIWGSDPFRPF